jgi:hypothetical protein
MKRYKYFTKNIDNVLEEIPEEVANDVIRQYFERRYIWIVGTGMFIIGFLLGVIANA